MRFSFILALLTAPGVFTAAEWGYDRCSPEGPHFGWPGFRYGMQQSPINLCGAGVFRNPPQVEAAGYHDKRQMTIINTGHSIQVGISSDKPVLNVGNLSAVVGRGTNSSTITWKLEQVHFHWGRQHRNDEGSEHYIEGNVFPFEAHLVHYNIQWGSVAAARDSGRQDAILVVGVLFKIGEKDLEVVEEVGKMAPEAEQVASVIEKALRLSDLFDGTGDYYAYGGSLTTPPCTEAVTWIVMKEQKIITSTTLENFKLARREDGTYISAHGNFRPFQNNSDRVIYSTGSFSKPCELIREPSWDCHDQCGAIYIEKSADPSLRHLQACDHPATWEVLQEYGCAKQAGCSVYVCSRTIPPHVLASLRTTCV